MLMERKKFFIAILEDKNKIQTTPLEKGYIKNRKRIKL